MKPPWLFVAGLLFFVSLSGCKTTAMPRLFHPGTAREQQNRALRYDPYPENEVGPSMTDSRPRDYDKPPPEAARSRWQIGKWGQ